jgi:hypothetical protein
MNPVRRRCLQTLCVLPWFGLVQARTMGDLLGDISVPQATNRRCVKAWQAGARKAIASLGQENGFFGDPKLKIGLPKNFARAGELPARHRTRAQGGRSGAGDEPRRGVDAAPQTLADRSIRSPA